MAVHTEQINRPAERRVDGVDRVLPLTGAGFVLAVLVGNTLTGGGADDARSTVEHLADSGTAQVGLLAELVGFLMLAVFVAVLAARVRTAAAKALLLVGGGVCLAVKLGSAALVLGAVRAREDIDDATAAGLLAANDAAFVLFWIGFGLVVATAARSLPGIPGVLRWSGLVLGGLTTCLGVAGAVVPAVAVPIPFLLGLLWTLAVSVVLTRAPRDFHALPAA